jgi:hypothetical protein
VFSDPAAIYDARSTDDSLERFTGSMEKSEPTTNRDDEPQRPIKKRFIKGLARVDRNQTSESKPGQTDLPLQQPDALLRQLAEACLRGKLDGLSKDIKEMVTDMTVSTPRTFPNDQSVEMSNPIPIDLPAEEREQLEGCFRELCAHMLAESHYPRKNA